MCDESYEQFEQWKRKVNAIVQSRVGLDCDDLPDYDYYSAWLSHMRPSECAREVVREAQEY